MNRRDELIADLEYVAVVMEETAQTARRLARQHRALLQGLSEEEAKRRDADLVVGEIVVIKGRQGRYGRARAPRPRSARV